MSLKGCFACNDSTTLPYIFGEERTAQIAREVELCEAVINDGNLEEHKAFLQEVQVMFCAWNTPALTEEQIAEYFPRLEVVFYAAGSVQYFARPFFARGVRILSAWKVMAIPVGTGNSRHDCAREQGGVPRAGTLQDRGI